MVDINLLPEDLRKKEKDILDNRDNFNLNEIEFTSGEKLKQQRAIVDSKPTKKFLGWLKPDMQKSFQMKEDESIGIAPKKQIEPSSTRPDSEFKIKMDSEEKSKNSGFFSKIFGTKKKDNVISEKVKTSQQKTVYPPQNIVNNNANLPKMGANAIDPRIRENVQTPQQLPQQREQSFKPNQVVNSTNASQKIPNTILSDNKKKPKASFIKSLKNIFVAKDKNENKKLNVNLLPEKSNFISHKSVLFGLLSAFVLSFMFVLVIYFGLYIYKGNIQKASGNLDSEISEQLKKSSSYDGTIKDMESWQTKARKINELLTHHIYWTKFFEEIEKNTLPNVKYSNFAGGMGGNLTLTATAPDYQTVVRQWMHLKRAPDFAKKVVISGADLAGSANEKQGSVSFSITLDLVDNIFFK